MRAKYSIFVEPLSLSLYFASPIKPVSKLTFHPTLSKKEGSFS